MCLGVAMVVLAGGVCLCLGQCVIVFVVIWVAGFGVLIDLVGDVLMVG